MKVIENYARKYLYNPGDMRTGLRFETDDPDGFVYGSLFQEDKVTTNTQEDEAGSDQRVQAIIKHAKVQFDSISVDATQYILQELGKILHGNPSDWRIYCIEPRPNCIRLDMVLKDDVSDLKRIEIDSELLEPSSVAIEIYGDDISEQGRGLGDLVILELKCRDDDDDAFGSSPMEYLRIHVFHNSRAECVWETEGASVDRNTCVDNDCYYEWNGFLRWKNKQRQRILAEIEEVYY